MKALETNSIQHHCSMEPINSLHNLETPCFVLDNSELCRSIEGFQSALKNKFSSSIIGYSVKTNSTPSCLYCARNKGVMAEVVSADEYDLARLCGYTSDQIIYNGPMKSKETFLEVIKGSGIVNIETKRELEWLNDLPLEKLYNVGIRLNINISKISPDDAEGVDDDSRFGFSDVTLELYETINYIQHLPNVRLSGLHIHRTAHSRSIRFYEQSIQYACDVIRKYHLVLDYLDIGGGFFGIFPNKPTFQQYSDAFYSVLNRNGLASLNIIVEPGNALVASCFSFVSEVIDVKQVEPEKWFITTDGSRNDIDPFFKKTNYLDEELYMSKSPIVKEQIISGCTCLEYDRMFSLHDRPLLTVGDRIVYHNVGAYTMSLSPMFIRYIPNIYLKDKDCYVLIREKWTAHEYIQKCKIEID